MDNKTIKENARRLVNGSCRICPVCDGRVCAGEVPGMGGAGTGAAFKSNITALAALKLNTRLVHEVRYPETKTEILGFKLALPLIIGPIGGISFNLGGAMPEAEYQMAVSEAAAKAGIVAGLPDSAPAEVLQTSLECIRRLDGHGIPFIKPWEAEELNQKIHLCAEAGCRVIGCDIDSAGLITLRKMNHPAFVKSQAELAVISETIHKLGMKFVVKGIMDVQDAKACLEAGVDGLVVSNHGGRILDFTPGTAEVLPEIAAAVRGRLALIVDGGVRSGIDILKMLALGADCVMIGRPYTIATIGGGREGVELYTNLYRDQLEQAMIVTGCAAVSEAGPHLLYQPK